MLFYCLFNQLDNNFNNKVVSNTVNTTSLFANCVNEQLARTKFSDQYLLKLLTFCNTTRFCFGFFKNSLT